MARHSPLAVPPTTRSAVSRSPWLLRAQSDWRLVELTRAGGKEAYEAIVSRYRAPLLRYCRRLLGPDRAEDVVQDTFIKAYTALRGSTDEIRVRAWLFRIAHNAAVTELRDNDWRHAQLDDEEPRLPSVAGPEDQLERSEHLRDVVNSVKRLPAGQRHAIVLRELEGRSYDEIAAELDTSRGSAHQLVRRARARLRAAAIILIPPDLLARIPWGALREAPAPLAGLTVGGGTSALAKAGTAVLAAGAVAAGVSVGEGGGPGASGREGGVPKPPSVEEIARPAQGGSGGSLPVDGVARRASDGQPDSTGLGSARSGHDGGSSGHGSGSSGHGSGSSDHGSGSSDHRSGSSGSGVGHLAAGANEGSDSGSSGSGSSGSSFEASDSSESGSGTDGGDDAASAADSSGESGSGEGGEGSG